MKFRNLMILSLMAMVLFVGCRKGEVDGVGLEDLFVEDADMVMYFDGSGKAYDDFKALFANLPSLSEAGLNFVNLSEDGVGFLTFEESLTPDEEKRLQDVMKIFDGGFEFVLGVNGYELVEGGEPSVDMVAGMYFEEADLFEKTMMGIFADEGIVFDVKMVEKVKYFVSEKDDLFAARVDDVFVFALNEESLDEALRNYSKGGGFVPDESVDGSLGYLYVGEEFFADVMADIYGMDAFAGVVGESYLLVLVEDDGVGFYSRSLILDIEEAEDILLGGNWNYMTKLDKVLRSEDLIFFAEQGSLKQYFDLVSSSLFQSVALVGGNEMGISSGEDLRRFLAGLVGLSENDLVSLIDNSFAVVMSDAGLMYPTMALYLNLDEDEDLAIAKKMTMRFDKWMDDVIVLYDELVGSNGFGRGALKKELELVGGSAMYKLYFDFDVVRDEIAIFSSFAPGLDLDRLRFEVYYGVANDEMFVLALHPDFAKTYVEGQLISDDVNYKNMIERFTVEGRYAANYMASAPMVVIMDRWVQLALDAGYMSEKENGTYENVIKPYLEAFAAFASVNNVVEDTLVAEGFFWIK